MVFNIGKADDHPTVQALLADHKCINCPRPGIIMAIDTSNRISDAQLIAFTAELRELNAIVMAKAVAQGLIYGVADNAPNVFYGLLHGGTKPTYLDGVEPLSDTKAPDPFIGRRP